MYVSAEQSPPHSRTLVELLQSRALERPDQKAFVYHDEEGKQTAWTYATLASRAAGIAEALGRQAAREPLPGSRAVLAYPPGLDFAAAFFGCLAAGVLPVPASYPRPRRRSSRLDSIVSDCSPQFGLTTSQALATMPLADQSPAVRELTWLATDTLPFGTCTQLSTEASSGPELAFLQYTSGSTSEPRGVMISHANLMANLEMIRCGFGLPFSAVDGPPLSGAFWLPAYHDMGLIGGLLTPLYVGGTSHLLAPAAFLRRPLEWLRLISETRASISGAPNFGYQACVDKISAADRQTLDLSAWQVAFCGAEPIDANVLESFAEVFSAAGFCREAFYPCYGLAEATLMVAGGNGPGPLRVRRASKAALARHSLEEVGASDSERTTLLADQPALLVGCGATLGTQDLRIVDPHTRATCDEGEIGEIWVRGAAVAQGYWNAAQATAETFQASAADGETGFLRTGDLGALSDGELFVTGRLKDLVIVRGRNLYPQDVERVAETSHPAVDRGAAFAAIEGGCEELVVVHQVRRENRKDDLAPIARAIRTAIVEEFEIDPAAVLLLRPGALPVTSSGKVQRGRCRELYLADEFVETFRWTRRAASPPDAPAAAGSTSAGSASVGARIALQSQSLSREALTLEVLAWLQQWLKERLVDEPGLEDPVTPFAAIGVDSLTAIELIQEVEETLGVRVAPDAAWACPHPRSLAEFLAEQLQAGPANQAACSDDCSLHS